MTWRVRPTSLADLSNPNENRRPSHSSSERPLVSSVQSLREFGEPLLAEASTDALRYAIAG